LWGAALAEGISIQSVRCEAAKQHLQSVLLFWNLYTALLFIFAVGLVIFLIYVIVVLIREDVVQSILGTLGTIVDGVALKWVVDRKKDINEELEKAKQWLDANCPNEIATVDTTKYRFYGKTP
jgi:hypothetical protein